MKNILDEFTTAVFRKKNQSWFIGRAVWLAGAALVAYAGLQLFKDPWLYVIFSGGFLLGLGNFFRHKNIFNPDD